MKPTATELVDLLHAAADAIAELVAACPASQLEQRAAGHGDQFLIDVLADRAAVPVLLAGGVGVFSEESGLHGSDRTIRVVLDPIDGSTNCSRGLDPYGPSMCAYDAEGPIAALVANLACGERHTATRGGGAWRNGDRIARHGREELLVVATGDPIPRLEPVVWTRVSGASAHDLCRVADGRFDAYVDERNTQSLWDYLGSTLILAETDATVLERDGKPLFDETAHADRRLIAARSVDLLVRLQDLLETSHPVAAPRQPSPAAVPAAFGA